LDSGSFTSPRRETPPTAVGNGPQSDTDDRTVDARLGVRYTLRMANREARGVRCGAWLVALGAALWGTESAWRIPLNNLFDAEVIVFWEHVLILLIFLPLLLMQLREIPRIDARTWGFLIFSGFAGSAVGTIFFTLALKNGNPTVVNVI